MAKAKKPRKKKTPTTTPEADALEAMKQADQQRIVHSPGHFSNSAIHARAGGHHQFANSIGGCGDNYR